ncbi:unnamed protein product [Lymnaea stagnalis]|uniref:Uncharacterized protein n=1 Tax=Lymnaea stagnalis TaxID=6523 RepID=A0AAV2I7K2_LYMST
MPRLFLIIGFALAILAAANGALFRGLAPCPDNNVAGGTWYPEGCMKCKCYAKSYVCESCGAFALDYNKSQCYEEPNAGGPYPDCCLPTVVCVEDPGFDSSKLANPPLEIDPPVVVEAAR